MVQFTICNSWRSVPGLERKESRPIGNASENTNSDQVAKWAANTVSPKVLAVAEGCHNNPCFSINKSPCPLAISIYYWWIQLLHMSTWLFSSITGIYNNRTVLASWCHPDPSQSCPSQFWFRSSNQSIIDLNSLKPSPESFFFNSISSLDITKDKILSASFSCSAIPWLWGVLPLYIKPVHLISSKGRLILGGLWDLIVSRPWCLSRSNTWVLRLLSWVQCSGPQLITL